MTSDEQLAKWLEGESIHNTTRDECCPDFSCCKPELLADEKTRKAFVNTDDREIRCQFLGMFLGAAMELAAEGKKVYIAGVDAPSTEH